MGFGYECPRSLDWIRLSDGGVTLDIHALRSDKIFIFLQINKYETNAPTINMNLGKIFIRDSGRNRIGLPLIIDQLDFRKSPVYWPIEPLLNTNEGYYRLTYLDLDAEQFILKLPDILVGESVVKLPPVMFQKKFGISCDNEK